MLVQCAWAAKRANNSYYKAQFFRLQARRGPQKAVCAVAASILTAIYHMLKDGTFHQDLGAAYFDRRSPETKVKRLARQIAKLGYEVTLHRSRKPLRSRSKEALETQRHTHLFLFRTPRPDQGEQSGDRWATAVAAGLLPRAPSRRVAMTRRLGLIENRSSSLSDLTPGLRPG
jgi:hypothetical protein